MVAGAAAAAGAYWYYSRPEDVQDLKDKTRREEEEIKRKAHDLSDLSKARAQDALRQGQEKYDEIRASRCCSM